MVNYKFLKSGTSVKLDVLHCWKRVPPWDDGHIGHISILSSEGLRASPACLWVQAGFRWSGWWGSTRRIGTVGGQSVVVPIKCARYLIDRARCARQVIVVWRALVIEVRSGEGITWCLIGVYFFRFRVRRILGTVGSGQHIGLAGWICTHPNLLVFVGFGEAVGTMQLRGRPVQTLRDTMSKTLHCWVTAQQQTATLRLRETGTPGGAICSIYRNIYYRWCLFLYRFFLTLICYSEYLWHEFLTKNI